MSKVLVETNFDYADEFDVIGFVIYEDVDVIDNYISNLAAFFEKHDEWERWFGTNEAVTISNIDEYKRGITITEITDEDADVIEQRLGTEYGTPIIPDNLEDF